jgi:hypothetical protein
MNLSAGYPMANPWRMHKLGRLRSPSAPRLTELLRRYNADDYSKGAVFLVSITYTLIAKWNMRLVNFVALVLAGGIGNLIDRVLHDGLVTDFLNLGIGSIRTGIFNVADMALTTGALVLVLACRVERVSPTPVAPGPRASAAD